MAAPVVVSKGTASASTTATVTPSYPASVGADDVLFLLAISNQPNGIGVINTPTDWTEVDQGSYTDSAFSTRGRAALFWRRATGSLSGTVSVTRTGDTGTDGCFFAQIYRITGAATSGVPWDTPPGAIRNNGDGATTVVWTNPGAAGAERTLLAFCAQADNASTVDPPSTYSGLVTDTTATGTDAELRLLYKENVSTSGSVNATGGETEGWMTFSLAIKPNANATVTPSAAGINVGANTPSTQATVFPSTAGTLVGAQTPTAAVPVAPSTAGVLVGAQTPGVIVAAEPAAAGVLVGAQAPGLALGVFPAEAGALVGANTPTLAVPVVPSSAGVSVGANVPTLDTGTVGTALGGLDANADKLTQQTDLPASLLAPYTITGWFKRTTNANEGGPACVWNGSSYNTLLVNTSGMARVGSNLGGVDVAPVAVDTWYFFALVQSGATRQLTGYIGGLSGGLSSGTHTSVNDASAVTDIIVGGGPYFGQQIRGSITEFRVWTRALSAAEVEAERDGQRVAASSTNLVGRYPLLDATTKLDAAVGTALQTTGSGSWTTDPNGPFIEATPITPSSAGATVGANAPALTVGVLPSTAGVLVGAQTPSINARVLPAATGVLLGANTPVAGVTVQPASAGVSVGAQAPVVGVALAATPAGALLGAQTPAVGVRPAPSTAGVVIGAQAPSLAARILPSSSGVVVGASAPQLAVSIAPAVAGTLVGAQQPAIAGAGSVTVLPAGAGAVVGAQPPALDARVLPATAGVVVGAQQPGLAARVLPSVAGALVGANAPTAAARVTPSTAGVVAGAAPPSAAVQLAPAVAGVVAGAQAPGVLAALLPASAGVLVGAWAPEVAAIVSPSPLGVLVGAPQPTAGTLRVRYASPGSQANAVVDARPAGAVVASTATTAVSSSPTARVSVTMATATPRE